MAFGTPYFIGSTGDSTSETQVIDVSVATAAGDSIVVATGSSATAATVSGITDTAGNIYVAAIAAVTGDEEGQVWVASYGPGGPGTPTTALTTSGTITVTYDSTSGEKALVAIGITGLSAGGGAVDSAAASNKGSGTAVSTTSGTLTTASEVAVGVIFNAQGGGSPTSVTGGWTAITGAQYQAGTSPYVTCYYQDTSATTALTLGATLVSALWSSFIIPLRAPVYLTNSFEGGTSGTAISTTNSGGNSGSAFNAVTTGSGATINFSNAEAAHGTLSGEFTEPATTQQCFVAWTTSLTGAAAGLNQVWFRAYCYFSAFPEASVRLISGLSSAAFCGGISISSSTGKFALLNAAGTAQTLTNGLTASTNAIPTGAWFRFEGYIIGSATTGQLVLSMYETMDSTTATESEATAATLNTTGVINGIRFGDPSDGTSFSFWLDDLGASDTGYLGPSLLSASSAIAGTGTATDLGDKTGAGTSSLAGTGTLTGLGLKDGAAAAALSGTGLLAGAGAKRGAGLSLVTATGALSNAFTIPVPSAIGATAVLAGAGVKTGRGVSAISATGALKAVQPSHPPVSAAFTTGYPRSRWNSGPPQTRWQAGYPLMRWPAGQ